MTVPAPLECSLGLMACNEEKNIGGLLDDLRAQEQRVCRIVEIVVVASGCTDRTEAIVRERAAADPRLVLVSEPVRRGKAAAINTFLARARAAVVIVFSTDIRIEPATLDRMIAPFADPAVGVTGGHIVPLNGLDNFMGFYVETYWRLHHRMALRYPRGGEIIAFRKVIAAIPESTCSDETAITALVEQQGLRTVYVPEAIIHNRGPATVRDLLTVRRRHLVGYFHIDRLYNYTSATMRNRAVFRELVAEFPGLPGPPLRRLVWTAGVLACEAWARVVARWDWYVKRKLPTIWEQAASTKEVRR